MRLTGSGRAVESGDTPSSPLIGTLGIIMLVCDHISLPVELRYFAFAAWLRSQGSATKRTAPKMAGAACQMMCWRIH